jgi:hypothetical protein
MHSSAHQSAFILLLTLLSGCASSTAIQRYSESTSEFSSPPKVTTNTYSPNDIYRVYQQASTGFVSIKTLRDDVEERADDFAKRQGKTFIVLGEQISHPPYILGNFPRIEIVFAVVDKPAEAQSAVAPDKYAQIERLKKLLDEGAITKEEYDREKAKILN